MAEDGRPSERGHPGTGCLGGVFTAALRTLQALWYRLMRDPDVYPPEAANAPDPVDEHFEDLEALFRLPAYIKEQSTDDRT